MKGSRVWLWLLIPLALGLWRLRFDVEVLHLLPGNSPVVQGLKFYQENFSDARQLILTVRAPEADAAEHAARALAVTLRRATNLAAEVTWRPGWEEHPDQSAELVAYLWLNQPPEVFGALTNRFAPANLAATLREAREQLATSFSPADLARRSYDPYNLLQLPDAATGAAPAFGSGQEIFSSPDGTFRLVFVQAVSDLANYRECLAWLSAFNAIVEETRARENIPAAVVIRRWKSPRRTRAVRCGE